MRRASVRERRAVDAASPHRGAPSRPRCSAESSLIALVALGVRRARRPPRGRVEIAGVEVGGLTPARQCATLEQRVRRRCSVAGRLHRRRETFRVTPAARRRGRTGRRGGRSRRRGSDGFGPVRGFRRLHVALFGDEVAPPVPSTTAAARLQARPARAGVDRPARRGAPPAPRPADRGRARPAGGPPRSAAPAARRSSRALGSFERERPGARCPSPSTQPR